LIVNLKARPGLAYNVINMNPCANADKPLLTLLRQFQLWNILINRILEPRKTVDEKISDIAVSFSFNILGLTGAILGA